MASQTDDPVDASHLLICPRSHPFRALLVDLFLVDAMIATKYIIAETCVLSIVLLTVFCLFLRPPAWLVKVTGKFNAFYRKHFRDRYVLDRQLRFFPSPWTRAEVISHLTYIGINVFCLTFRTASLTETSLRAGNQSVINLMPVVLGLDHNFLADAFHIRLQTYRQFHRSAGFMSLSLLLLHVAMQVIPKGRGYSYPVNVMRNRDGLIGFSALVTLGVATLFWIICRRRGYELFLRTHQALTILGMYGIWGHIPTDAAILRWSIIVCVGIASLILLVEIGISCKRNNIPWHMPRALVFRDQTSHGVVVILQVEPPLKLKAGEWVNVWIPGVRPLESHPFMVTSWTEKPQSQLKLLVESRRGFTRSLYNKCDRKLPVLEDTVLESIREKHVSDNLRRQVETAQGAWRTVTGSTIETPSNDKDFRVFISGPHGTSVPAQKYEAVLMFATDYGLAAHLPYLEMLIHERQAGRIGTSSVQLIWQIYDEGCHSLFMERIRLLLKEDRKASKDKRIFTATIHCREQEEQKEGRIRMTSIDPQVSSLVRTHLTDPLHSSMIILVAACTTTRIDVRKAFGRYSRSSDEQVLEDLDFQPSDPLHARHETQEMGDKEARC